MERPARKALGNKSPELVWAHLKTLAWQAVENHFPESQQLAEQYGLQVDLNDFLASLEEASPVRAINEFHYSNPKFNLQQDLIHQAKLLDVLEALIRMDVLNDRLQSLDSQ